MGKSGSTHKSVILPESYKVLDTEYCAPPVTVRSKPGFGGRSVDGGLLESSVGKESACSAGDPGSIPGLGTSPGEEIGYPLQYPWASVVAQLVKNLPAMQETWVRSLGWEDPPRERKGYPLQCSDLESSIDCIVHGVTKSQT